MNIKKFEEFSSDSLNERKDFIGENAFNNFSPEEKKGWKRAENKIGDTYFIPSDETEYKKMMKFLGSKNWRFWNTENIPGFSSDNIDPNKLPAWKSGIGFKLGGTRTGNTYVIPTEMKASTQGAKFDYDDFSKVFESNETISESVYPTSKGGKIENSLRSEEIGRLNLKYKGDIVGTLLVWMKPGYIFGGGGGYDENYWEVGASYTSYPMSAGGRFSDGSTGSGVWSSSGYKSKDDAIKAGKEFMKNVKMS